MNGNFSLLVVCFLACGMSCYFLMVLTFQEGFQGKDSFELFYLVWCSGTTMKRMACNKVTCAVLNHIPFRYVINETQIQLSISFTENYYVLECDVGSPAKIHLRSWEIYYTNRTWRWSNLLRHGCDVPDIKLSHRIKQCSAWLRLWESQIQQYHSLKFAIFQDIAPCIPYMSRYFGGTYHLHLQGRKSVVQ
jgi:hypothetical protein